MTQEPTTPSHEPDHADRPAAAPEPTATEPTPHETETLPGPAEGDGERRGVLDQVEEPAKVMRLGTMIKQLLDEVRSAPLDEAARDRLVAVHEASVKELESGLSEDLVAELHRVTLPFSPDDTPTDAELRIAHAQLVGWLEGLFHGIQTALVAQQVQAQQQAGAPRQLPPGVRIIPAGAVASDDGEGRHPAPGQYL